MSISEKIDYWTPRIANELGTDTDAMLEYIVPLEGMLKCLEIHTEDNRPAGVFAWIERKSPTDGKMYAYEVMLYIIPSERNIKTLKGLLRLAEYQVKAHGCERIVIASNIGYNDSKILRMLTKFFGYEYDSVRKDL